MIISICEIGVVKIIEQDILVVDIHKGEEVDIHHVSNYHTIVDRLAANKKISSIIDQGSFSSITKSARELFIHHVKKDALHCNAIIVRGLGQLIIAKHLMKTVKINTPTRIFTNYSKAKNWINQMKLN